MTIQASRIWHFLTRHKVLWVCLLFIIVVGFVDRNSYLARYRIHKHNAELQRQIDEAEAAYAADSKALRQLKEDPEAVEEVARVRLFMKNDDEDVYVIDNQP
ncbi:MAG: septum formation initiator family protein [Alloprevotella sp.]|nr:septum formation initiator family protein [Alloprevotella sp.]